MKRLALLLTVLTLAGFGCTKPAQPGNPTPPPLPIEEPAPNEPTPSEETLSVNDPCPSGTVRYWYTDEWGEGLTFCHEKTSVNGLPVTIHTEGNTTAISIEGFEQTVVPLGVLDTETVEELVEQFMTPENKEVCTVVANKGTHGMDQYVITGADLEAQESCGSAKDGGFYVRQEEPRDVFYVRTGQDALFPTETWIETLRRVYQPGTETSQNTPEISTLKNSPLAHYENAEMGIAFDYPVLWGPILQGEERGSTHVDADAPIFDCTHQRQIMFSGLGRGMIVGVVGSTEPACEIMGRGGYFGDISNQLIEDLAVTAPCEEGRVDDNEQNFFGEIRNNVDEYAAFHKGHPLPGIIFSDERLISEHLDALDPLFTAMIKSIELIPAK